MSTDSTVNRRDLWIGLFFASVSKTAADEFGGARLAAVNAIGAAQSGDAFVSMVRSKLASLGLVLNDFEDVEPLEKRMREFEIDDSLMCLIKPAELSGTIQFGTFHVTEDEGPV